jgi:hypothetical protein
MKISILLLATLSLGGCAIGLGGGPFVPIAQPEVYIAPPIIIGPVWRRLPFHPRLKLALSCPAECGSKWANPNYPTQNPNGDFAWQVCVSVSGGNPQTCIPAK